MVPRMGPPASGAVVYGGKRGRCEMLEKNANSVTFVFEPAGKHFQSVTVAGEFNGWNAGRDRMTLGPDGRWRCTLNLAPGEYQYKYVADGQWLTDPHADGVIGAHANSVVRVAPPSAAPPPPVAAAAAAPTPAPAAPPSAQPAPVPSPMPAPAPAPEQAPAAPPEPPRPPAPRFVDTGFTKPIRRQYIRKPPPPGSGT